MNHEFTCCNCERTYDVEILPRKPATDTPTIEARRDRMRHVCGHCGHDDRFDGNLTIKHKLDPPYQYTLKADPGSFGGSFKEKPEQSVAAETTVSTPEPTALLEEEAAKKKPEPEQQQLESPSS